MACIVEHQNKWPHKIQLSTKEQSRCNPKRSAFREIDNDAQWNHTTVACEPLTCDQGPPEIPNESYWEILYSPNPTTNRQFETEIVYHCPANDSLPELIKDEYTFAYAESNGIIRNITAICQIDG